MSFKIEVKFWPLRSTNDLPGDSDRKNGGRVKIYLRPEDVFISEDRQKTSARNVFRGNITSITHLGQLFRITFENGLSCLVTKQSMENLGSRRESEYLPTSKQAPRKSAALLDLLIKSLS